MGQFWALWDPNNSKEKKGRFFHFFCTWRSKVSSTWAVSTPSLHQGRSDILILGNKQPEAQRKLDPMAPGQCIFGGKKLIWTKKPWSGWPVTHSVHSPGPFLWPKALNIYRLAANRVLSERKDDRTFHLEKYQEFTPSDSSFPQAPEDIGCLVGSAAENWEWEHPSSPSPTLPGRGTLSPSYFSGNSEMRNCPQHFYACGFFSVNGWVSLFPKILKISENSSVKSSISIGWDLTRQLYRNEY